jgi:DNA-directed RNA polymerase subunit RPC12/RpoP
VPTLIYCSRCGETISDYFGDEEYFEYGCKYCFDLPFGSFLKERIK